MAAMLKDEKPKPWRLSISVRNPNEEIILSYDSRASALTEADAIVSRGYALVDREADASNYDCTLYFVPFIRSISVYEK